ncbi:hypothetical protein PR048_004649 [Dryococelus australis]|uniref:Uncharacterized protein n=1 Tax=Dryococelus australis TaxID=614101 RepID=A0ABQ9I7X4_9NEOP|nr:hypothetical protein PR048_004649 [Dryococelus australis]
MQSQGILEIPEKTPPNVAIMQKSSSDPVGNRNPILLGESGATVAKRLACSPPIKSNRVQSPVGSPGFLTWESCRRVFSGISSFPSPFIPAFLHTHINHSFRLSRPHSDAAGTEANGPVGDANGAAVGSPLMEVVGTVDVMPGDVDG